MQQFDAAKLDATVAGFLTIASLFAVCPRTKYDLTRTALAGTFNELSSALGSAPEVSKSLRNQFARLRGSIETATWDNRESVTNLCVEFVHSLTDGLGENVFLYIKSDRRTFYEQPEPPFGPQVEDLFPNAKLDISHAARCIAFDEWTACVFHLMRVLEHGLRYVANDIGLTMSPELDEQWKTLIDRMLSEISKLEGKPKTPEKAEQLKFYSTVGLDLRNFKNAWRNDVSHSRETYDERQAMAVWDQVRRFMQAIAVRIAP